MQPILNYMQQNHPMCRVHMYLSFRFNKKSEDAVHILNENHLNSEPERYVVHLVMQISNQIVSKTFQLFLCQSRFQNFQ